MNLMNYGENSNNFKLANYNDSKILSHRGNPLIESLPPIKSLVDTIKELTVNPQWDISVDRLDDFSRIMSLDDLYNSFQPIPSTVELKENIDRLIRLGYVHRNPMIKRFNSNGTYLNTLSVIGISGIGKSTNIERILSTYDQIIYHDGYKSLNLRMPQLVYLRLNCPYDSSVKGLLLEFYSEIDRLLGTNYYERFVKTRATVDVMTQSSYKVATSCNLGVLVIDEIQHINVKENSHSASLLNFFTTFANALGVPIIYIGTPAAFKVFRLDFREARRTSGVMKTIVWKQHENDEVFKVLVESLWSYQITEEKIQLTDEMINLLYFESQGIVDVLKKLFIASQVYSVQHGEKCVNEKIIKKVSKENFSIIEPLMIALKSGNKNAIFKYKDLYIPESMESYEFVNSRNEKNYKVQPSSSALGIKKKKPRNMVETLKNPDDIRNIVGAAEEGESAYEALKLAGYIDSENSLLTGGKKDDDFLSSSISR